MAKLVVNKCPSCSAPVEVQPDATDMTCRYCGNSIHIERKRAPTRPETNPMHAHVMYIDPNAGARFTKFYLLGMLPLLIPVALTLGPFLYKKIGRSVRPLPATCGVNDELEFSGAKFEGPGPHIIAEANCKIRIANSTLKGNVILRTQGANVKIDVVGSTLEASETAFELSGSSNVVRISEKSSITSERTAFLVKSNVEVNIEDSTVKSKEAIVRGDSSVKVNVARSELTGRDGFQLGTNPDVVLRGGTLRAEGYAVTGESNLKFTCDGCSVEAADGLRGNINPKIRLSNKGKIIANGTAIEGRTNLEVEAEDSRIEAKDVAILGENNLKVRLNRGAVVKGGRLGIRGDSNPELNLRDSTVEGGTNAIEGGTNGQVEASSGTIKGGALAFAFRSKPRQLNLAGTNVVGGQNFASELSAKPTTATPPALRGASAAPSPGKPQPGTPTVNAAPTPAGPPAFDGRAAMSALDVAAAQASSSCKSTSGKTKKAFVDPGFIPDGSNANAKVRIEKDIAAGSPEVLCIERIFRGVRIPAFDEKTKPSGMGRFITLNP